MSKAVSDGCSGRDSHGRFLAGNKCGKGNPHLKHIGELQRRIAATFTLEEVVSVLRVLYEKTLAEGDPTSAKVLLGRLLGKEPEAVDLSRPLSLPPLDSAEHIREAASMVARALAKNEITSAKATSLCSLIEQNRKSLEVEELERRICALEAAE